jgi:hypothetical protein
MRPSETGSNVNNASGEQSIEQLQERYQQLNRRKIQAETSLEHARQQLEQLKQDARERFQTDDLAELRRLLDLRRNENEQKRRDYQMALDRIEAELAEVEQKYQADEPI